ncbi:MAG: FGGY family carbohydrate kinase [Acidimicrobiales bacterium]
MAVTVGIDIGTTSVKAVAVDDDGRVLRRARVVHEVRMPGPGVFEHDPDLAWRAGVLAAFEEVRQGLDVVAVNVAAMVPSLCAVDADGRALTPGLLYGDARGGAPSGANPSESGELLGFLRWCAAEAPDAAGFWPAQAVANHALCGVGAIDSVTAMTTLPLFDFTGWDPAVCAEVGVRPEQLPAIVTGTTPAGETADGVVVGGGTIDAFGEQLVAGADHAGDVFVVLGTTLVLWAVVPDWVEVPGLWTVPHTAGLDPGRRCLQRRGPVRELGPAAGGRPRRRRGGSGERAPAVVGALRARRAHAAARPAPAPCCTTSPSAWDRATWCAPPTRRPGTCCAITWTWPGCSTAPAPRASEPSGSCSPAVGCGCRCGRRHWRTSPACRLTWWPSPRALGGGRRLPARAAAGLEPDASGASRWAATDRRVEPDLAVRDAVLARYASFRTRAGTVDPS